MQGLGQDIAVAPDKGDRSWDMAAGPRGWRVVAYGRYLEAVVRAVLLELPLVENV